MRRTTRLTDLPIDAPAHYREFVAELAGEGAIVTFTGAARPSDSTGAAISGLFLDHHPRMTERSLREIAEDAGGRFDVAAITIVHRFGEIAAGDAIVFVATAARHRRAAFEAAEYAMDRLKTDAVFWKREDAANGSRWIEPTLADEADRARWSN